MKPRSMIILGTLGEAWGIAKTRASTMGFKRPSFTYSRTKIGWKFTATEGGRKHVRK